MLNTIPIQIKKDYTFQFISKALSEFSLENYIKNIIEIIVFDSIIGNSDRHQENWGILSTYVQDENIVQKQVSTAFDKIKRKSKNYLKIIMKKQKFISI